MSRRRLLKSDALWTSFAAAGAGHREISEADEIYIMTKDVRSVKHERFVFVEGGRQLALRCLASPVQSDQGLEWCFYYWI